MSRTVRELAPDDPRHGTRSAYINHGCRCDDCRRVNREYCAEALKSRTQRGLAPDDPRHGKVSTYVNWGCRCDGCSFAWRIEMRIRRRVRLQQEKT